MDREVEILKRCDEIVMQEKRKNLAKAFNLLTQLSEDFFAEDRNDSRPQDRESF